ncbi:MAG: amino acid-binding protein [Lachnospira sp.]|nr:amino acid-binding protein [Lachnospira sp.]
MYIKQLSVFIENREGRLDDVLEILKTNNINIISLSLADTADYGMLRLIVNTSARALEALKNNGFSASLTDVTVVRMPHKIGQLQELASLLCKADINIEYMYSISIGQDDACIVFKTSGKIEQFADQFKKDGVEFVTQNDIAAMVK